MNPDPHNQAKPTKNRSERSRTRKLSTPAARSALAKARTPNARNPRPTENCRSAQHLQARLMRPDVRRTSTTARILSEGSPELTRTRPIVRSLATTTRNLNARSPGLKGLHPGILQQKETQTNPVEPKTLGPSWLPKMRSQALRWMRRDVPCLRRKARCRDGQHSLRRARSLH